LNKLANITSGKGISILILLVNTPDRDKLIIEEIAKKYGWIVMDFTKVSKDPKFILHEKDNHFNPLGNQLIAEEIYQKLIENKLIPFK
jgi:lysophospholipase L1-like esterase